MSTSNKDYYDDDDDDDHVGPGMDSTALLANRCCHGRDIGTTGHGKTIIHPPAEVVKQDTRKKDAEVFEKYTPRKVK